MKAPAPVFPAEGIAFLRALKKNNDREWFTPRKDQYESKVRQPMLALVAAVHKEMLKFAPAYVGEPAKTIFRVYRDTRFAKDKTPYKTHIGSYLWRNDLDKGTGAGFYFAVSPEETVIAGGMYNPLPAQLLAVRHRIVTDYKAFVKTFSGKKMPELMGEMHGNPLLRPPKGFTTLHPAIQLIQCRQFVFMAKLPAAIATSPQFVREVVTRFQLITPFVEFLNSALQKAPR